MANTSSSDFEEQVTGGCFSVVVLFLTTITVVFMTTFRYKSLFAR